MREIKEYKKGDTLKQLLVLFLLLILLGGMIASYFLLIKPETEKKKEPEIKTQSLNGSELVGEVQNSEFVKLEMGTMTTFSNNAISKTLKATVLPATANNKKVNWSVGWKTANSLNVSDYVTVTPSPSDSTIATVTCHKSFSSEIVITATTEEGGYKATCRVVYKGYPTDAEITTSCVKVGEFYKVAPNRTYTFTFNLTNDLGSVGADATSVKITTKGVGSFVLGYMEHFNATNNDIWYDGSNKTVTLDSMRDNFIDVNWGGNTITVTMKDKIENYCGSKKTIDSGRTISYTDKFRYYLDDNYFVITIAGYNNEFKKEIKIRFDESGVV